MGVFIDLTGKVFGRLTVLYRIPGNSDKIKWMCRCECGIEKQVSSASLRRSATLSCGCLNKSIITKHGMTDTQEFSTWNSMINRCYNPKNRAFGDYGARGITVCDRWKESFENFLSDMGFRPDGLSLDRIDNDKGYSPENCRWATRDIQTINTRVPKGSKSGHKGVNWDKKRSKWRVVIAYKGKTNVIGRFNDLEQAIDARKQAELIYWPSI